MAVSIINSITSKDYDQPGFYFSSNTKSSHIIALASSDASGDLAWNFEFSFDGTTFYSSEPGKMILGFPPIKILRVNPNSLHTLTMYVNEYNLPSILASY